VPNKDLGGEYFPYKRDEKLVREWVTPGTKGKEHRIGGLEKEELTGNVSYDSDNHEKMIKTRENKVNLISKSIPLQELDSGKENAKLLVLGWGSTYGAIKTAMKEVLIQGYSVSYAHIKYIHPFPANLGEVIANFDKVLVPEINNGQLVKILRDKYAVDAIPFNKIKGIPFESREIKNRIIQVLDGE
jgi:2-oxoglutarate ferredoxin oxidoreductase subunit alpha